MLTGSERPGDTGVAGEGEGVAGVVAPLAGEGKAGSAVGLVGKIETGEAAHGRVVVADVEVKRLAQQRGVDVFAVGVGRVGTQPQGGIEMPAIGLHRFNREGHLTAQVEEVDRA